MPAFIKGEGRYDQYPIFVDKDAVQQRRNMPVIAQIIGGTPIERYGSRWHDAECFTADIGQRNLHQLDLMRTMRHKIRDFGPQSDLRIFTSDLVPQESGR